MGTSPTFAHLPTPSCVPLVTCGVLAANRAEVLYLDAEPHCSLAKIENGKEAYYFRFRLLLCPGRRRGAETVQCIGVGCVIDHQSSRPCAGQISSAALSATPKALRGGDVCELIMSLTGCCPSIK